MENTNRLYRSRTSKMIGGVAGGLAEHFNVDPVFMRLLFIVIVLAGGSGILIYIIMWIVVPLEPYSVMESKLNKGMPYDNNFKNADGNNENNNKTFIVGVSLIVIGLLFLFNTIFPQFNFSQLWPLVLVLIGAMLILNGSSDKNTAHKPDIAEEKNQNETPGEENISNPDSINKKTENNEI